MSKISSYTYNSSPGGTDYVVGNSASGPTTNRFKFADIAGSGALTGVGGIWWQELGRTTLSSNGNTIALSGLTAKKYLKIIINVQGTGGTISIALTFNSDTGANYSYKVSSDGGSYSGTASASNILITGASSYVNLVAVCDFSNISAQEKIGLINRLVPDAAGAGYAPAEAKLTAKWANTSAQATSLTLTNTGAGQFASGSELVVLGHD